MPMNITLLLYGRVILVVRRYDPHDLSVRLASDAPGTVQFTKKAAGSPRMLWSI